MREYECEVGQRPGRRATGKSAVTHGGIARRKQSTFHDTRGPWAGKVVAGPTASIPPPAGIGCVSALAVVRGGVKKVNRRFGGISVKMGGMKNEYAVNLKAEEQYHLRNLTKSVTLSVRALKRAQVLLEVDERVDGPGWSDAAIAEALEVASPDCVRHSQTISRTRAGIGSTGSIHRP